MRMLEWLFPKVGPRRSVRYPRYHERIAPKGMRCPLGEVIDISEGGMRVRSVVKPSVELGVNTRFNVQADRQVLSLSGIVVWVKRVNRRTYEIGVKWTEMMEPVARMLMEMARTGFVRVEDHAPKNPPPGFRPSKPKDDAGVNAGESREPGTGMSASMELEDLYALLGVSPEASQDDILHAYRALARKLHPDHNTAPDASEKFAVVHKAYTVLRDPIKRRKYDAMMSMARSGKIGA